MFRQWLDERAKTREMLAAKAAAADGPMCPLQVFVPITPGSRDERGLLPGTDEEQEVLFALQDELVADVHRKRVGVVGGVEFERRSAYVYIWCNDPRSVLRGISPILNRFPTVERVRLTEADFKHLAGSEPTLDELRPPF